MADCIQAKITSDLKTAVETVTTANGYNTNIEVVETLRSDFDMDVNSFALLYEHPVDYEEDFYHTNQVVYRYSVIYFGAVDDKKPADPYTYTGRNVCADIIKAVMVDKTRNGNAQNTEVTQSGPGFWQVGSDDAMEFSWPVHTVNLSVFAMTDATDPYQLAG